MGKRGKKVGEVVTHGLSQEKAMLKDNAVERLESFKKANEELLRQCTLLTASRDSAIVAVEELHRQNSELHANLDAAMDESNRVKAVLVREKLSLESNVQILEEALRRRGSEIEVLQKELTGSHETVLNLTRDRDLATHTEKAIRALYQDVVDRADRFRDTMLLWCLVGLAGAVGIATYLVKGV